MSNHSRTIQQTHTIATSREKVFKALTDPKELTHWWMSKSLSDPRAGGSFEYVWEFNDPSRNGKQTGEYLEVVPNQKLRYPWEAGDNGGAHNTTVEFTLRDAPEGDAPEGTLLELAHTGYKSGGDWDQVYEMTAQAWGFFLGNLKAYLENGEDNRAAVLGQKTK
ncbi:MAG TPA: SRPBCC domain-containing protein [Anaerolineales bacterium]|nr:SRPBCC domain-containing protein [Anaerolineales bacterium]